MAKKEVKKGGSQAPSPVGETAASPPLTDANSMEKIRDILFGNQLKDFEKRLTRLEERVGREAEDIRGDLKKRFDTLEAYVRHEIESFSARLKKEQESRSKAEEAIGEEIKVKLTTVDGRISALDTQLGDTTRELRQQLLEQSKALSEEIQAKADQAALNLEQAAGTLQGEKVDRTTLSSFLVELAVRLSDEPTLNALVSEEE
jgi:isoleucyl-tRNA synthetase